MSKFVLRDYQQQASDVAVDFFRSKAKGNGLIVAPTGAGKSLIVADIARQLDGNVMILQPNKELLEQNYAKLAGYDIEGSVYSASMRKKEVGKITFATIKSVANHMELFDEFAAVIIDECHLVNSAEGQYKEFLEKVPRKVLGLTATPYRLCSVQGIEVEGKFKVNGSYKEETYFDENGYPKPGVEVTNKAILKFLTRTKPRIFNKVLFDISIGKLVRQGYLSQLSYYPIKVIDTSRVAVNSKGRDYEERSLFAEFERCKLGVQLAQIIRRLLNPKSGVPRNGILVFTRFVQESEALCRAVPGCAMLTSDTKPAERKRIISQFRSGEIKVLANVNILTTGFDYPALDTIVMARPTMSLAVWYQVLGRAVRPYEGKEPWIVDLGGNYERFGKIENLRLREPEPGKYAVFGWLNNEWTQLSNVYY